MVITKEIVTGRTGIQYEWPFQTERITKRVWVAKTNAEAGMNAEITMQGDSEQNAIDKLKFFLNT
jgi:hypothetical protein